MDFNLVFPHKERPTISVIELMIGAQTNVLVN